MTTWNERANDGWPPGWRAAEAQLTNGLAAVVVEAPAARQSRLALGVGVGYLDEPAPYPGLAHLLEHALFLGSLPGSRSDSASLAGWVGARGGRYNAHTDEEATDYHLTLPPAATAEGLKRLLSLVASPRFQTDVIDHEVSVIDAEFQARLADPALHRQAALSRLCLASHPARFCHAGNRATLGGDAASLCRALSDFHEQHYRAGCMALVMLSPLALSEQQALIETAATPLATGGSPPRRTWCWADEGNGAQPRGIRWASPTGERTLELLWPVPPHSMPDQQRVLERIVAALMNGELATTLTYRGWLRDLTATTDATGSALSLTLTLTAAGCENVATMLATCQAAVHKLANQADSLVDSSLSHTVDLDRWSIEQVRKLARDRSADMHGESMPSLSDQTMLATWLASRRCRVLEAVAAFDSESLQAPVTGTRYQSFAVSPECATPLALIRPPTLEPRRLAPLEPQVPLRRLSSDGAATLWHGGGPTVAEASLCLGWPSDTIEQEARLRQWQRASLVLRQAAASQGVILTLGGDAQGDWLIAQGQAALLESVATQA
ncbi:MAG TPA: insulinase family protein, partial [Modicisalibacter sp.]|nr:insulinase family protein [Modicisalibacter sp.]